MYLPVLMIRDFGDAGWLVFALPNILGAAALGWVLHRPGAAANLARQHWRAACSFSIITVLFHAFFVGWVIRALIGDAAEIITAASAAGFYLYGYGRHGRRDLLAAAGLLAFSLIAFGVAASVPALQPHGMISLVRVARPGLIWLAPVCIFGFFLCPYLDLTFLRARASTDANTGIAAFTVGFGILFLAMIGFTFWYARFVEPGSLHSIGHSIPRPLAWIIGGHMMLQTAFTIAVHTRALSEDRRAKQPDLVIAFFVSLVIAFLVGAWSETLLRADLLPARYNAGEFVYRLFMSFYGLIFPAYVWLCMIPAAPGKRVPHHRRLAVLAVTLLLAAPMFWLGFIGNRMIWLGPGLLVVIVSRFALVAVAK